MCVELKIKNKHLSEEAKIIRFEERKIRSSKTWPSEEAQYLHFKLSHHRRFDVRNENRATSLARAYIAGKPYSLLEKNVKDKGLLIGSILPRVLIMINKYRSGPARVTMEILLEWIK